MILSLSFMIARGMLRNIRDGRRHLLYGIAESCMRFWLAVANLVRVKTAARLPVGRCCRKNGGRQNAGVSCTKLRQSACSLWLAVANRHSKKNAGRQTPYADKSLKFPDKFTIVRTDLHVKFLKGKETLYRLLQKTFELSLCIRYNTATTCGVSA